MLGKIIKYVAIPAFVSALSLGAGYFYLAEEGKDAAEQEEREDREKSHKRDLEHLLKMLKQQKRMSAAISYYYSHQHEDNSLIPDKSEQEESKGYE